MKALVKVAKGAGNVELRDVPEPEPGPGEVLVEVKAAGVCGTDLHILHDEYPYRPPVTLGHEFCGVVAAVGPGVTGWRPGERVTSESAGKVCGRCRYCMSGDYHLCADRQGLGSGRNGAFARYVVVEAGHLFRLPDEVDFVSGALSEPIAACVRAVNERTGVGAGDVAVVSGPGPIGLIVAQLAKAEGATVVVLGTSADEARLALARRLGADLVVDVERENALSLVREISAGYGADVAFECAGVAPSVKQCVDLLRKGGKLCLVGLHGRPVTMDIDAVAIKELSLFGTFSHRWIDWPKGLALLAQGKIQAKPLVSHNLPLTEWKEAFRIAEAKTSVKVLMHPVD